jgi:predicted dehydrogenase
MKSLNRRGFLKGSALSVAACAAPAIRTGTTIASPNDGVNVAVVGLRNRGKAHYHNYCGLPNVQVGAICDIDERLFAPAVAEIEKLSGRKPKTYVDFRELIADKSVDAVSLATPDHWHALQTIWACQAGKDVYVEKPMSWCVEEGRRAVQAARKHNRIVQVGSQYRSNTLIQEAVNLIQEGKLGRIYMIKTFYYGFRANIGRKKDGPIPEGVHWDLFLGPAPYRPFNENRFHYNWHWFWDTGNSDLTANGVHFIDIARWSLAKRVHPARIHSDGGYYVFDSDQETPNIIYASCEYEDKTMLRFEIHNLYTPIFHAAAGAEGIRVGALFFGSEGWMQLGPGEFRTFFGNDNKPGPAKFEREIAPDPMNRQGTGDLPHFVNFLDCVRSRKWQNLNSDILEGHLSATICHLAEISYRTGRRLAFNSHAEKFIQDSEADSYLTRDYRYPYVVPEKV